jgi:hypothetical protein
MFVDEPPTADHPLTQLDNVICTTHTGDRPDRPAGLATTWPCGPPKPLWPSAAASGPSSRWSIRRAGRGFAADAMPINCLAQIDMLCRPLQSPVEAFEASSGSQGVPCALKTSGPLLGPLHCLVRSDPGPRRAPGSPVRINASRRLLAPRLRSKAKKFGVARCCVPGPHGRFPSPDPQLLAAARWFSTLPFDRKNRRSGPDRLYVLRSMPRCGDLTSNRRWKTFARCGLRFLRNLSRKR